MNKHMKHIPAFAMRFLRNPRFYLAGMAGMFPGGFVGGLSGIVAGTYLAKIYPICENCSGVILTLDVKLVIGGLLGGILGAPAGASATAGAAVLKVQSKFSENTPLSAEDVLHLLPIVSAISSEVAVGMFFGAAAGTLLVPGIGTIVGSILGTIVGTAFAFVKKRNF